jgi:hypothetical protein
VPVFSFRFHAEDEELEEVYPSAEETDEDAEKQGILLGLGLCPVVVHNDYMVLDRHTHNTFTGITILF